MSETKKALTEMRRRLESQERLSVEQRRRIVVELGIGNNDGRLTIDYGGDAKPEPGVNRRTTDK